MSGGGFEGRSTGVGYPVGPLLERSRLEAGPIEVGVSMAGTEPIDENELDVFLVQSTIGPGERIELGIFVSGVGDLEATDLSVFYDDEAVLDLDDPGILRRNVGAGRERQTTAGDSPGAVRSASVHDEAETVGTGLTRIPLTGSKQAGPGYILELNTRSSAPAGEYPLPVVFTYRSVDGIKQVRKIPTVRIQPWRGRLRRLAPWLLVFFIILSVVVYWVLFGVL